MKIGIYYDTLLGMGGAERVVVQLANELGAEIVTAGYDPNCVVHDIGNTAAKWSKPLGHLFESPLRFFFYRKKFNFDVRIYCGFTSIYGVQKNSNSIWHCLSPNRIIYDLRKQKLENQSILGKAALLLHIMLFSYWDKSCVKNFKAVVCQSKTVQARVKRYYDIDSKFIYDPIDTSQYKQGEVGDYFLAVSRLYPEKRMLLIARAFSGTKHKLVLVGNGPERAEIIKIVNSNNNISLLSDVSEAALIKLYGDCRATIYMPLNEDYGLVPLEGMAAGKPCIAVNEGGCRETIIDGKTGFLVRANVKDVRNVLDKLTRRWVTEHTEDCRKQALKFDIMQCAASWIKLLNESDIK